MTYCLDSWAVIALLEDEERSARRVEEILMERPVMSWINIGEVYYVVHRRQGERGAAEAVRELRARLRLDLPTGERVLEAAAIKAVNPIAYADAFAVATAIAYDATLVTGDPEILRADLECDVENIR